MPDPLIHYIELHHQSTEFDAAYDIISADIAPEFLETRDFLRNRLRVRDQGPETDREQILLQDGYTLHLIAAVLESTVVGAVYGHLISHITSGNRSVCFVTYLAVHPDHRRRGIGTGLVNALREEAQRDALRLTGEQIIGMVYEIEEDGKREIKALASRLGAQPLDIVYYQPALRPGYEAERMDLWFQPIPAAISEQSASFALSTDIVTGMVRNMLAMEYVGPELKGFDFESRPYRAFLDSLKGRSDIGFKRESQQK